ncbi:hypothetical protein [Nocardioides lijunqiniae]|uniref:hypothetical protein n=1 Tax=Nocardioides lijunqiniae TaxID=2760832 RepID=UPI001877D238|nr:hypothetical protein [Nocardioides lijunqiniae]
MEVVPVSVGEASRAWDEQHLDLDAAAAQIADADPSGFTGNVRGSATRFLTQWERHAESLGTVSEQRADGLRTTVSDYVTSDEATRGDLVRLASYLHEVR